MSLLTIAIAQLNSSVGDFEGNSKKALKAYWEAKSQGADLVVFPEMFLCGYPVEDLVGMHGFVSTCENTLGNLAKSISYPALLMGGVRHVDDASLLDAQSRHAHNTAAWLEGGEIVRYYDKVLLPTYGVFDEARWFGAGKGNSLMGKISGVSIGVVICEDIWADGPAQDLVGKGAQVLVVMNASPYHRGKKLIRQELISETAQALNVPILYVNLVGGQDELVFDGCSLFVNNSGEIVFQAESFVESLFYVEIDSTEHLRCSSRQLSAIALSEEEEVWQALTLGLKDYVQKSGFENVVIGLSGGIDSALTAVLAVDALSPDHVRGLEMPSRYSSRHSLRDASLLATNLGICVDRIGITPTLDALLLGMNDVLDGNPVGVTEENMQARIRGMMLMAMANQTSSMVLSTGNKSELSCGYATLYGDMAGGFAPLKDVSKLWVYRLARWRNTLLPAPIPLSTIGKPPSAELRPDQKDIDSLPPYDILDPILELYIEKMLSSQEIIDLGYDSQLVKRILRMVDNSEYKRRQGAPGIKVSPLAFGRERRLPICNHFRSLGP